MDRLLTLIKAAERLAISKRTVYRLIEDGSLPAVLLKDRYRVRQSDLNKFIDTLGKEKPEYLLLGERVGAWELKQDKNLAQK